VNGIDGILVCTLIYLILFQSTQYVFSISYAVIQQVHGIAPVPHAEAGSVGSIHSERRRFSNKENLLKDPV